MVTRERLKELLIYNQKTGLFYWREQHNNRIDAGGVAGCISKGYELAAAAYTAAAKKLHGEFARVSVT